MTWQFFDCVNRLVGSGTFCGLNNSSIDQQWRIR